MKRKKFLKKTGAVLLAMTVTAALLAGCGKGSSDMQSGSAPKASQEDADGAEAAAGDKVFYYGDTTFNAENDEPDVNPHYGYSGWACIRYGIGETLFKYSDAMELEPWLATEYKNVDENTWTITLRDGVTFTSGRAMDGAAVKECLEDLVNEHQRAKGDLKIKEIAADGQTLTITTEEPVPALINYLSDPYGCIIDMEAGVTDDGNVSATGPYKAIKIETDKGLTLVKNENYWDGEPKLDAIYVQTITDGDTMTMSMQSGELDGAYGLPYASLPLFTNDSYTISSVETSRSFYGTVNYKSEALQDEKVREAIAGAIDKENFTQTLMNGNGSPAAGPFPAGFTFGDNEVTAPEYDPEASKKLLAEAGWEDADGDGYLDKDGQKLTIRWLTYPSRQELPLLAESAQAALKDIGVDVQVNCTANHLDFVDSGDWDIYASAMVTAPTGDPEYFFTTHCMDDSSKNWGGYHSDKLEKLEKEMSQTFDTAKRSDLAVQMTQTILDDNGFIFAAHLKMSIVAKKGVTGFKAHPCDYYEITADLDKN